MSLGQQIAPHLPFLRRFGRALLGSQAEGDKAVRATLERIVAKPEAFPRDVDPRLALYRTFLSIVDQGAYSTESEEVSKLGLTTYETIASSRMAHMSVESRRALLLTALEGFTENDAGYLMEISEAEVHEAVASGLRELDRQTKSRVLIVEDEPLIAMDLESIVRDLGHDVTSVSVTRSDAVKSAHLDKPDLVIADIELADGSSGIDAVSDIIIDRDIPVIFITAFPERLLLNRRVEPTFLITKPFMRSTVKAAISQSLFFHEANAQRGAVSDDEDRPDVEDSDDVKDADDEIATEEPLGQIGKVVAKQIKEIVEGIGERDAEQLPSPVSVVLQGSQLSRVRFDSSAAYLDESRIERLRVRHFATAQRLVESQVGRNLGNAFSVRFDEIAAVLSQPLDATSGLDLGVQAKGLRTMLKDIDASLAEMGASDLSIFISDITDFAWLFPDYREFVALAAEEGLPQVPEQASLVDAAKAFEALPEESITEELRSAVKASRVNAEHDGGIVGWFGLRRVVENIARAIKKFLIERVSGVNENIWKAFDKTGGGVIGAVFSTIVIAIPVLSGLAYFFPESFKAILEVAKLAKLMIA